MSFIPKCRMMGQYLQGKDSGMEIGKRNYRIAVVVMMMEHEFAATRVMMASLLLSARPDEDVWISLLLNGACNKDIESYFTHIDNLTYYCSSENLGVAGGRNYLLTRREVIEADIIMILDNDLLLPEDYVGRMARFLIDHPDAGLIGPVMAWARNYRDLIPVQDRVPRRNHGSSPSASYTSDELRRRWIETGGEDDLYYLGTHSWFLSNCLASPISIQNLFLWLKKKKIIKTAPSLLLNTDANVVSSIKGGAEEIETKTVTGGGQVFRSSLLFSVGLLEPAFSPYGHEDHEFSIRVVKAGYKNYINCSMFILHGIDERQTARHHEWRKYHYSRIRTITTRRHVRPALIRYLVIGEILLHTLVTSLFVNLVRGELTFPSVRQGVRGWMTGLTVKLMDIDASVEAVRRARDTG